MTDSEQQFVIECFVVRFITLHDSVHLLLCYSTAKQITTMSSLQTASRSRYFPNVEAFVAICVPLVC